MCGSCLEVCVCKIKHFGVGLLDNVAQVQQNVRFMQGLRGDPPGKWWSGGRFAFYLGPLAIR